MLYFFVCLRPSCSKRADAIKVFSGVIHDKNPFVKFATNSEFDQVENAKDKDLMTEGSKYAHYYEEEKTNPEDEDKNDL